MWHLLASHTPEQHLEALSLTPAKTDTRYSVDLQHVPVLAQAAGPGLLLYVEVCNFTGYRSGTSPVCNGKNRYQLQDRHLPSMLWYVLYVV